MAIEKPSIRLKVLRIRDSLRARYVNRSDFIEAMTISALSGLDFFALGTPGTAKSAIIKEFLNEHFKGSVFTATLDRTTVASRLVGNVHPKIYMESGVEEHQTKGMIVEADMAFVDEVFKGAKGCRETLLDILADRTWKSIGEERDIPLLTMFSASNELPTDNEDAAFYSRLQIRVYVNDLLDGESIKKALWAERPDCVDVRLTREDILRARKEISELKLDAESEGIIINSLLPELQDLRVVIDQRKRQKAFGLDGSVVQTAAWLAGHETVQPEDIFATRFAITGGPRDFDDIKQILMNVCIPAAAKRQTAFNETVEEATAIMQHPEHYTDTQLLDVVKDLKAFGTDDLDDSDRATRSDLQRKLAGLYLQRTGGSND